MPMIPLFNENGTYTLAASELDRQIGNVLAPFFANPDYSTREVLTIATMAAVGEMSSEQVMRGMRRREARLQAEEQAVDVVIEDRD